MSEQKDFGDPLSVDNLERSLEAIERAAQVIEDMRRYGSNLQNVAQNTVKSYREKWQEELKHQFELKNRIESLSQINTALHQKIDSLEFRLAEQSREIEMLREILWPSKT